MAFISVAQNPCIYDQKLQLEITTGIQLLNKLRKYNIISVCRSKQWYDLQFADCKYIFLTTL